MAAKWRSRRGCRPHFFTARKGAGWSVRGGRHRDAVTQRLDRTLAGAALFWGTPDRFETDPIV